MNINLGHLADTAGFDILEGRLAGSVRASLRRALKDGAVFAAGAPPLSIFRSALKSSIREIEKDPQGKLLQRFLRDGPYEKKGPIPKKLRGKRLSDDETKGAITFIYSHMVNCFKGHLAELLACSACSGILRHLKSQGSIPRSAHLYHGDSVSIPIKGGGRVLKGADFHILAPDRRTKGPVLVLGVVEVKSYRCPPTHVDRQLDMHIRRLKGGIRIGGVYYSSSQIRIGGEESGPVIKIGVVPSNWKLPRTFRWRGNRLHIDRPRAVPDDQTTELAPHRWQVVLRWSEEALAEAAYEMTFWYAERVGEAIYSSGVPKEWSGMTAAEAGRNALKMMLYYAMLRPCSEREDRRAIALYNTYGFGYALGMNFRNEQGQREMLWPEDLREMAKNGRTKHNCRICQ